MAAGTALARSSRIRYRIACADRHAHLFAVTLQIDAPAAGQAVRTELS